MSWKDDKMIELAGRSAYVVDMKGKDPAGYPGDVGDEPVADRGISAVITSWDDSATLVVEAGVDQRGEGFVIATTYDGDGNSKSPVVLDLNDSVMIQTDSA